MILYYRWATTDLKSQGRLSIDSSGTKNVNISAGLGGSKLEARGGIVGGYIELHQLHSYCKFTIVLLLRIEHFAVRSLRKIVIKT